MKKISKDALRNSYLAGIITESELSEKSIIDTPTPITLSKAAANPELAKSVVKGGHTDGDMKDDSIKGGKVKIPVGNLRASQTEIRKEYAFGIALGLLLKGNWENQDLGNIVSNDNYIMDGHHRWAAISLIDPKANAIVTQIDLPGIPLVSALNIVTVGDIGITKGNEGKGSVAEFTGQNLKNIIEQAISNGIGGDYPKSIDEVKKALSNVPGASGDYKIGAQIIMQNADKLPKEIMPGAPARVDMPVIDSDKVDLVKNKISKGEFDIKEPHSQDVLASLNESSIRKVIREEIAMVMQEMGEEDPMKLAQDMIKSNEEQVKSLEDELKYREADMRVSNLPKDEKDARVATMKLTKDRLEQAKQELELSKQTQLNAVKFTQMQTDMETQQATSSQTEPQA